MVKTAIFVEGQTELIFVREFLLRYFEWQNISVECFTLVAQGNMDNAPYDFLVPEAPFHFQIINVGNDQRVLKSLLKREKQMWQSGFARVIGLRDMYCEAYRKIAKIKAIYPEISRQFKQGHQEEINRQAVQPDKISFHFAIMETEAWLLGLTNAFSKMDASLTVAFIQDKLGFNLEEIDPEMSFFHPANEVAQIFGLAGRRYGKKEGDIEAAVSGLEKMDYDDLLKSENVPHFGSSSREFQ